MLISWIYAIYLRLSEGGARNLILSIPLVSFIYLITQGMNILLVKINDVIAAGTAATSGMTSLEFASGVYIGLAERFFPLSLVLQYIPLLLSLWSAALLYRFIKSLIPTLS